MCCRRRGGAPAKGTACRLAVWVSYHLSMVEDQDRVVTAVIEARTAAGYRHVYVIDVESESLLPDREGGPEPPDRVEIQVRGLLVRRHQIEPVMDDCADLAGPPQPPKYLWLDCLNHTSSIKSAIELAYKLGHRAAEGKRPQCVAG